MTMSAISGFQYNLNFPGPPLGVKFLINKLLVPSDLSVQ